MSELSDGFATKEEISRKKWADPSFLMGAEKLQEEGSEIGHFCNSGTVTNCIAFGHLFTSQNIFCLFWYNPSAVTYKLQYFLLRQD